MTDPTPDEVRITLCRVLGWTILPGWHGHTGALGPDGGEVNLLAAPDPAADLNAMAAVEAKLTPGQLWDYVSRLAGASPDEPGWEHEAGADAWFRVATAPAAVRAVAAYRVLIAAKDEA